MQKTFALTLCLIHLAVFAAPPPESEKALSPKGIARLTENLAILRQSIEDTKKNVETSRANVATVENDVVELDSLQKQYLELRKKHLEYQSGIQKEWAKNEAGLKELAKFEAAAKNPTAGTKLNPEDLERALREKGEREAWKETARQKLDRAAGLIRELDGNLATIQQRRAALLKQKSHWLSRANAHRKTLRELETKLSQTETRLSQGQKEKGHLERQPSSKNPSN